MSPRVGVIVALIAAALLATSIATPAWWSGHPTFDGKQFDRKTANIGLITANQCNFTDGEESDCKHLSVGGSFAITKWVQLGFTGILALSLLLLAISRNRGFAKLVMIAAAGSAVMAVVLLVTGPNLKTGKSEAMPLGYGFFLFFGGTALGIFGGVIMLLPQRRPSKKLIMPLPSQMQAQPPPAGFDVHALLAEGDAVRPAQLGPEPVMGSRPQSPGGMLPGPAGPLVPPSGPQAQPLFNSAPQLRPLYEATGGYPPAPTPVQFPSRGPTPMPHAAVSAALGLDPDSVPVPVPGPTVLPVPPIVAPAAPKLPPPNRTKTMSAAPPLPARRPPPPATRPPPPGAPTKMSAVVPPPPPMLPVRPQTEDPADLLQTNDYEKVLSTGDSTSPNLPFDSATAENETKAFQNEERTDVGDELETHAREKVDHTDPEVEEAPPRVSATSVELDRGSSTSVEVPKRADTSVISSASPPPRRASTPAPTKVVSTAADDLPPPAEASPASGPSPACPQCEAPMAWVEEHLRFYCKSCRMYF